MLRTEPEAEQPRRKPGGRVVSVLLALATLGFLAWSALPLAGLESDRYTVALVALTQYAALAGIVLTLLALVLRRWLTMLIVLVVTGMLIVFVAPRAIPGETPAQGEQVRVLSINTYFGRADANQIVELVRQNQVDVLSLQELTPEMVTALDTAGLSQVLPYRVFQDGPMADGSGIAARHPLRQLSLVPQTTLAQPSAQVDLPGERDIEVVAVHPLYPMGQATAETWGRDLGALPKPAGKNTPRVLAGDFNATLDHAGLKNLLGHGYTDAAERTGDGLYPTWPGPGDWFPPPVTIDHVLTSEGIAAQAFRTFDVAGGDHRAILATLTLTP